MQSLTERLLLKDLLKIEEREKIINKTIVKFIKRSRIMKTDRNTIKLSLLWFYHKLKLLKIEVISRNIIKVKELKL